MSAATLQQADEIGAGQSNGQRVKFALVLLSGSRRGETREFDVERLTIGTDHANDLALDPAHDAAVSLWHAELSVENCELVLRDKGSQGGTFVNHQCVAEVILQDGDLITLGQGGPQLRIRIRPEAYAHCGRAHHQYVRARRGFHPGDVRVCRERDGPASPLPGHRSRG